MCCSRGRGLVGREGSVFHLVVFFLIACVFLIEI